uniref:Si:ch211-165i18.2 n=1 Tax=Oryzias latipes TaxID=8090 RepID=A0A3P9J4P9_ORYLA
MNLWAVLTVTLCGILPTGAEVVNTFIYCSEYFYKGKQPQGFDQNAKQICQKTRSSGYFFASLYSTVHRIPLYSAYTFSFACNNQEGRKSGNWFIEPQLSKDEDPNYATMPYMKSYTARDSGNIKVKQSIDEDYKHTGYDRGHLNPNSFQCNNGRGATFTLTNAVPMDACFNRVHWKNWEAEVIAILRRQDRTGTAYLVTGAVPSSNVLEKIPKQGVFDEDDDRDFNRVTVPTHIWTAVCYIHPTNEEESFSFGYIGLNKPHGSIHVKKIADLTIDLSTLYVSSNLKIFEDDCTFSNQKRKSETVIKELGRRIQLPMGNRLTMTPDVMNTLHAAMSLSDDETVTYPAKRGRITDLKVDFIYNNVQTWLKGMEAMKLTFGLACLLSTPFAGPVKDELRRKRQTSQELVCRIAPEVLDGCATSCLFNEEAKDYYCSTGTMTVRCSPTYSDIAVNGERCKNDHTCGHHGSYDYYWCNTESSWQYCSPPLPLGKTDKGIFCGSKRNCAKYGYSYYWCDLDDGSWQYCTR